MFLFSTASRRLSLHLFFLYNVVLFYANWLVLLGTMKPAKNVYYNHRTYSLSKLRRYN